MASQYRRREVVIKKGTPLKLASDAKSRKVVVIKGTGPKVRPPNLWDPSKPPGGKLPKSKPSSEKP